MKNKNAGPVRILTVAFAITFFAAYIIYAQLEHNRALAPSSKSLVLGRLEGTNFFPASPPSNSILQTLKLPTAGGAVRDLPVLPGAGQSRTSVAVPRASAEFLELAPEQLRLNDTNLSRAEARRLARDMVLSSSKSAAVFDPFLVQAAATNFDLLARKSAPTNSALPNNK